METRTKGFCQHLAQSEFTVNTLDPEVGRQAEYRGTLQKS